MSNRGSSDELLAGGGSLVHESLMPSHVSSFCGCVCVFTSLQGSHTHTHTHTLCSTGVSFSAQHTVMVNPNSLSLIVHLIHFKNEFLLEMTLNEDQTSFLLIFSLFVF